MMIIAQQQDLEVTKFIYDLYALKAKIKGVFDML